MLRKFTLLGILWIVLWAACAVAASDESPDTVTVEENIGKSQEASKTDDEVVQREEEAIKVDGLNVAQMKEMREKSEKHAFQAEVNRMMKLIINSLYKNKEIFLRELISNASDALDKIRFLALTDNSALSATEEFSIKIKADKENHVLHVTDTGIGMTKNDLINNLGTIAKSGTSEFLQKLGESTQTEMTDLIGQFGVGFYSSFLVADKVMVTSKNNDDDQYIWESDSDSFHVSKDPRGNTLARGTTISLHLKEEAHDFLEESTLKELIQKYSQFINFNIYLWTSKTEKVEEPIDEEEKPAENKSEEEDEEGKVEEEKDDKPKTKTVEKTIWDWELLNSVKPIWSRKPAEIKEDEYEAFYKSISNDNSSPLAKIHFTAEGEVTFKSILYVPKISPHDMFNNYGKKTDRIKMYVRRVFITDDFEDMMPKYLNFVTGVVDSDDLPLNVSRETLQQHKLLKVIKKKLVRKTLDMIKKIDPKDFKGFWKEYSTNIKLGVIEDPSNRTRLAKLLRFYTSNSETDQTSLGEYVERMKDKQTAIYFVAGSSHKEVKESPFVERLFKKGYEVLYLIEPVDEYCIQALPEFEGKKFQNVAKEGLSLSDSDKAKEQKEVTEKEYEPLLKWLKEDALKDQIEKATISERLSTSPCALVAGQYGWSGNMERIMRAQAYAKAKDPSQDYFANQKKTLEINPRHKFIKILKEKVEANSADPAAKDLAVILFETATMRSGYMVIDNVGFAARVETMLKSGLNIEGDNMVEEEPEAEEEKEEEEEEEKEEKDKEEEEKEDKGSHHSDEL